ncbi:MAG: hypothetical protein P8186_12270 [Anaerolineae bacterium]
MRSNRSGLICLWVGVILLAAVSGWLAYRADRASRRWHAMDGHLSLLQSQLEDGTADPAFLRQQVQDLRGEIHGLAADAAPFMPLLPHLRWMPVYGGDLAAAPALLRLADRLVEAADVMAEIAVPLEGSQGMESVPLLAQTLATPAAHAASAARAAAGSGYARLLLPAHVPVAWPEPGRAAPHRGLHLGGRSPGAGAGAHRGRRDAR